MSFNEERGISPDPEHSEPLVMPGEHEEEIDLTTLQREGLEVQEGEQSPEEALAQNHPTPGHITGRLTP